MCIIHDAIKLSIFQMSSEKKNANKVQFVKMNKNAIEIHK